MHHTTTPHPSLPPGFFSNNVIRQDADADVKATFVNVAGRDVKARNTVNTAQAQTAIIG